MLRGFDLAFDRMYTPNFASRITEGKVKEGESNVYDISYDEEGQYAQNIVFFGGGGSGYNYTLIRFMSGDVLYANLRDYSF